MARIKSKGTNFEKQIFKELRIRGVRFKTHCGKVVGNPDIAIPSKRKAVFLHSDFWHGWRLPAWEHILPNKFWKDKLKRNRKRDAYVLAALRRRGWSVLIVWSHSYKKYPDETIAKIARFCQRGNVGGAYGRNT